MIKYPALLFAIHLDLLKNISKASDHDSNNNHNNINNDNNNNTN